LEEQVLDFIKGLRGRGVPVSTAESIDAMDALLAVGVGDHDAFKTALKSAVVKNRKDLPIFEELFPLYFYGLRGTGEIEDVGEELRGRLEQALLRYEETGKVDRILRMLLSGSGGEWESLIQQAAGEVGMSQLATRMQVGMYTRRIFERFDWDNLESELEELVSFLGEDGWQDEELESLKEAYRLNRETLRRQIKRYVQREQARNLDRIPSTDRLERLMKRPLSGMDELELQQMRKVVDILARKLRSKMSMRERQARKGKLDVKATLRRNMQHGGVPFELVRKKKRLEKSEVMVLCDISSSVARVSQFMLQFVYTVQDCLAKVRSFVFVDGLGEVTGFFREEEIDRGVRRALSEADISYNVRSDFGQVFRQFCDQYLQDVGYRTYILIIGDARNNYNDPAVWALEKIKERAKGIIWLNPETEPFWDTGDSVMGDYLPYCREARVCRTLRDLEDTIGSLLL
jgi:uncharacterized protein with von Willebrand factor type A (vWA) domain